MSNTTTTLITTEALSTPPEAPDAYFFDDNGSKSILVRVLSTSRWRTTPRLWFHPKHPKFGQHTWRTSQTHLCIQRSNADSEDGSSWRYFIRKVLELQRKDLNSSHFGPGCGIRSRRASCDKEVSPDVAMVRKLHSAAELNPTIRRPNRLSIPRVWYQGSSHDPEQNKYFRISHWEMANGGSLSSAVEKFSETALGFPEPYALLIVRDLLCTLNFMYQPGYTRESPLMVHGAIGMDNVHLNFGSSPIPQILIVNWPGIESPMANGWDIPGVLSVIRGLSNGMIVEGIRPNPFASLLTMVYSMLQDLDRQYNKEPDLQVDVDPFRPVPSLGPVANVLQLAARESLNHWFCLWGKSQWTREEGNWATATLAAVVRAELSLSKECQEGLADSLPHQLLAISGEDSCGCNPDHPELSPELDVHLKEAILEAQGILWGLKKDVTCENLEALESFTGRNVSFIPSFITSDGDIALEPATIPIGPTTARRPSRLQCNWASTTMRVPVALEGEN